MLSSLEVSSRFQSRIALGLHGCLCFLLVTVPLIPYPYLVLPDLPRFLLYPLRFAPAFLSLLIGLLWWAWRRDSIAAAVRDLPLGVPVLALFAAGMISSLGSEAPGSSLSREVFYFLTGGMLFLVVADFYSVARGPETPLLIFVLAAYLVALYGLAEFVSGRSPIYRAIFSTENEAYLRLSPDPWFGKRILSSIGHPVFAGVYLVLALPVSMSFVFRAKSSVVRGAFLAGSLAILSALMLTFSRGSWVAGLVSLGVYLRWHGRRYLLSATLTLCVILLLFLSFGGVSAIFKERVLDIYDQYVLSFSSTTRGQSFAYVAAIVERDPLLGIGTGMYRFSAYVLRTSAAPYALDTPDNMYLIWMAERGALGMCVAIFTLVLLFKHLLQASANPENSDHQETAQGFVACVAGFCVNMLTCSALSFPVTRVVFWILAGMAIAFVQRDDRTPPKRKKP